MMLNKRRRRFHSSRAKLPLVSMSTSWFLVSTDLIWILGSKLILSNPQSSATLCSGHVSHRWTSSIDGHFDDSLIVFNNVQLRLTLRRMCVSVYVINIRPLIIFCFLLSVGVVVVGLDLAQISLLSSWLCFTVLLVERNTLITICQRSRAGNPSMRNPASREMISDSVELCETEVCFLHIQLIGTNV